MAADFFGSLERLSDLLEASGRRSRSYVVYGGASGQRRTKAEVVPWREIASVGWVTPPEDASSRASGR